MESTGKSRNATRASHRRLQQRRRFRKPEHQIEILHRRAGGAFDQVVFGADQQHAAAHDAGRDIEEVRVGRVLGRRQVVDDADERLAGVELAQAAPGLRLRSAGASGGRRSTERMPRSIGIRCGVKITSTRLARGPAENLLDLRLMAMLADAVGRDALVALGKVRVQLRRAARAGNAALAIDDDVVRLDPARLEQRRERQNGGRGIAAGIGDELGLRESAGGTVPAGRRAFCPAAPDRDGRARTTGGSVTGSFRR